MNRATLISPQQDTATSESLVQDFFARQEPRTLDSLSPDLQQALTEQAQRYERNLIVSANPAASNTALMNFYNGVYRRLVEGQAAFEQLQFGYELRQWQESPVHESRKNPLADPTLAKAVEQRLKHISAKE